MTSRAGFYCARSCASRRCRNSMGAQESGKSLARALKALLSALKRKPVGVERDNPVSGETRPSMLRVSAYILISTAFYGRCKCTVRGQSLFFLFFFLRADLKIVAIPANEIMGYFICQPHQFGIQKSVCVKENPLNLAIEVQISNHRSLLILLTRRIGE